MDVNSDNYDPLVRGLVHLQELCSGASVPEAVSACVTDMLKVCQAKNDYTQHVTSKPSQELCHVALETKKLGKRSAMMTGPLEGEFLKSMVTLSKAKHVLDIGTFTGYSALALAEALPVDGMVDTCDIDPEISNMAKSLTLKSKHASKISFHVESADRLLTKLASERRQFDLIFIDGNKDGYKQQYDLIMANNLLSEKGAILFDNAYMNGYAYVSGDDCELTEFGRHVSNCMEYIREDMRVHKVLVPIRDGVLIVQRT